MKGFAPYFGYLGHAIFATALIDDNRFWYKNSWGKSWGEDGFGTLHKDDIYWDYGSYVTVAPRNV